MKISRFSDSQIMQILKQAEPGIAVAELFDECWLHSIPESIRYYVDYDSFARDCELSGDLTEFDFNNRTYNCTNASGI